MGPFAWRLNRRMSRIVLRFSSSQQRVYCVLGRTSHHLSQPVQPGTCTPSPPGPGAFGQKTIERPHTSTDTDTHRHTQSNHRHILGDKKRRQLRSSPRPRPGPPRAADRRQLGGRRAMLHLYSISGSLYLCVLCREMSPPRYASGPHLASGPPVAHSLAFLGSICAYIIVPSGTTQSATHHPFIFQSTP